MKFASLLGILFLWCIGCATGSAADLQQAFDETMPLCEQFFLPNSMARPAGFNIDTHVAELDKQIDERSYLFRSHEGTAFLIAKQSKTADSMEKEQA